MDQSNRTKSDALNRHFERAIPRIIEKAAESISAISPVLREMDDAVDELRDHLSFELEKASLALEKREWASQADTGPARERVVEISSLLDRITTERLIASRAFLEELTTTLQSMDPNR